MIFTSFTFFIFFFVFIAILLFSRSKSWKKFVLLAASYVFYAFWDWRFLFLILLSTGIDFIVGEKIAKASSQKRKKFFLLMSLVANLSILGFFKYFNFFIESANVVFGELGLNLTSLNIILPVGISFYTFQTMSYTIDIYRGSLKPSKSLLNFAIFVGFFPQLVAGPIVRAREFLPQLKKKIAIRRENIEVGLQIFVFGAFKKIIIADRLAFFVDEVFANPSLYDSATIWLGVVAYAIQIFCDFSGYSDMAIGIARILGLHLPKNFNMPYIAQNIRNFGADGIYLFHLGSRITCIFRLEEIGRENFAHMSIWRSQCFSGDFGMAPVGILYFGVPGMESDWLFINGYFQPKIIKKHLSILFLGR